MLHLSWHSFFSGAPLPRANALHALPVTTSLATQSKASRLWFSRPPLVCTRDLHVQAMTPIERGVDDANVESDNPCRRKYRKDAPVASLRKQRCKEGGAGALH